MNEDDGEQVVGTCTDSSYTDNACPWPLSLILSFPSLLVPLTSEEIKKEKKTNSELTNVKDKAVFPGTDPRTTPPCVVMELSAPSRITRVAATLEVAKQR